MPGNLTTVDTEIVTIDDSLALVAIAQDAVNTTLGTIEATLDATQIRHGLPEVAMTAFSATNAAALATAAAPQEVKAAVAVKRHFITELFAVNITTAEKAMTFLQDEDDVIACVFTPLGLDASVLATNPNAGKFTFNPPLVIASGKALEIHVAAADVGDVFCTVNGFVED